MHVDTPLNEISGQSRSVVVIGAGAMGSGIAAHLVAHGRPAVLLVRDRARIEAARAETLTLVEALGESERHPLLSVETMPSFAGWANAALVIESIKEDLALKQELFAALDTLVPAGVPIGSNSSSYAISRIAGSLPTRARMFNTHYFMPAHRVPLVEVVLGAESDPALGERVCALLAEVGKKPVLVKREIAGFLANRIQHALMREVLALIDAGVASPEDIDVAVRYSFGFRYAAIGPVLQKEISGWDSTLAASREIYPALSNSNVPAACLERLVAEGRLGMKSGAGFMAWTAETAAAVRTAYDARLAAALELLE
jgi:3-hydroxybutyryl-CoA dehydrogenase